MKRNRLELVCLAVAAGCFGFDLIHFAHHLRHDATLLELPGVKEKLFWKIALLGLAVALLIFSRQIIILLALLSFMLSAGIFSGSALASSGACEQARELLEKSGVARDASEGFLGKLKIKGPQGSFPSEMDQVTWWGTFKPFEFWENPEFQAVWVNPRGEPVSRSPFRGGACALAKTVLRTNELPQGQLEPGMWRVVVSCRDVILDNHPFAVIGPSISQADTQSHSNRGIMIWADDHG